jgi:hypothetical protein
MNEYWMKNNLNQYKALKAKVQEKAVKRAIFEGYENEPRVLREGIEAWALDKLSYYQCHKCNDPYYGGLKECGEGNPAEPPVAPPAEEVKEPEIMEIQPAGRRGPFEGLNDEMYAEIYDQAVGGL